MRVTMGSLLKASQFLPIVRTYRLLEPKFADGVTDL